MEEVGTGVTPEPCKLQTEQSIHICVQQDGKWIGT